MAATTEMGCHQAHIHFGDAASGDEVDTIVHGRKGKDNVEIFNIFEFVDQTAKSPTYFSMETVEIQTSTP